MRSRHSALTPEPRAWTARLRIRLVSPWFAIEIDIIIVEIQSYASKKRERERESRGERAKLSSLTCKYRGIGEVKVQAQNRLTFAIRHTHTHKRPTAPKNNKKKKKQTDINTGKCPCHTGWKASLPKVKVFYATQALSENAHYILEYRFNLMHSMWNVLFPMHTVKTKLFGGFLVVMGTVLFSEY